MKRWRLGVGLLCVGMISTLAVVVSRAVGAAEVARLSPRPSGFTVEEVAPGVHALVRAKKPGMMLDANTLFIIGPHDVVVVDANLTPGSAEASIAALGRLTDKPVRLLVNTHRHADHTGGNAVYRERFPGLTIVGSTGMRADLEQHGQATLDGWIGWGRELAVELPKAIASGQALGGTPLGAIERSSYEGDLAAAQELVADAPRARVALPDLTVTEGLTLYQGQRTIEIRAPGKGHTRGDLVVWLPGERVLAAGDLVVAPMPLVGADQSYPEEWVATLDRLLALGPRIIVPGHGPVLQGDARARLYRDFLKAVVAQTRVAMARGSSAEEAARSLELTSLRERMVGSDPVLRALFANWGPGPAVQALYRVRDEAKAKKTAP